MQVHLSFGKQKQVILLTAYWLGSRELLPVRLNISMRLVYCVLRSKCSTPVANAPDAASDLRLRALGWPVANPNR